MSVFIGPVHFLDMAFFYNKQIWNYSLCKYFTGNCIPFCQTNNFSRLSFKINGTFTTFSVANYLIKVNNGSNILFELVWDLHFI